MAVERIELWLRSVSSWSVGRDGTYVDDLEELTERGVVDDYEVVVTNGHVPLDPEAEVTPREEQLRAQVREMMEWAETRGYDLPAFDRTRTIPQPSGRAIEAQVLPLAVLAGYEGDQLAWVAPYSDGDHHVTVQDRLDELAERTASESDDEPEKAIAIAD